MGIVDTQNMLGNFKPDCAGFASADVNSCKSAEFLYRAGNFRILDREVELYDFIAVSIGDVFDAQLSGNSAVCIF